MVCRQRAFCHTAVLTAAVAAVAVVAMARVSAATDPIPTGDNVTVPNNYFTRAVVNATKGKLVLGYSVPPNSVGVFVYAAACYGSSMSIRYSEYAVDWNWVDGEMTTMSPEFATFVNVTALVSHINIGLKGSAGGVPKLDAITSGIFDVFVSNNPSNYYSLVPVAGKGNPAIVAKMSATKDKATISWTTTGDSRDTYSVYRYDVAKDPNWRSMMPPAGYFISACSSRLWMHLDNAATKVISFKGTAATTSIAGIVKENVTIVSVVVQRNGGYEAVYDTIGLNSAPLLGSSLCAAVLLWLVPFLFASF